MDGSSSCPSSLRVKWTMKLWDSLTTCLILLSSVHTLSPHPNTTPPPHQRPPPPPPPSSSSISSSPTSSTSTSTTETRAHHLRPRYQRPLETPLLKNKIPSLFIHSAARTSRVHHHHHQQQDPGDLERMRMTDEEQRVVEERLAEQLDSVVASVRVTVRRTPRSASPSPSPSSSPSSPSTPSSPGVNLGSRANRRREGKKPASMRRSTRGDRGAGGGGGGGGGAKGAGRRKGRRGRGGQGCVLKQIHLNVSDLGLGYQSEEEMIFRYCSGPCRKSETNYDKILHSMAHGRRLGARDTPPNACCRPIVFDDDLSFLDDNLMYHTIRKHSARKCACV